MDFLRLVAMAAKEAVATAVAAGRLCASSFLSGFGRALPWIWGVSFARRMLQVVSQQAKAQASGLVPPPPPLQWLLSFLTRTCLATNFEV